MNSTRSPLLTLRVSGPDRITSDHTHRRMGVAAVAGISSPPLDLRSASSGTRTSHRSPVRRIFGEGSAAGSGLSTLRRLARDGMAPIVWPGSAPSVQDGRSHPGSKLVGGTEERADRQHALVETVQRVFPGEADPTV